MPPGQEKFVGIAELKGWGYSNSDIRGYLSALSILQVQHHFLFVFSVFMLEDRLVCLVTCHKLVRNRVKINMCVFCECVVNFWMQDYYPERLGKLFIVNAPYIFMKVWQIIYPFIDNKTKKKVMS